MSEAAKKIVPIRSESAPADDSRMIVTMTASELRAIIRDEIVKNGKGGDDRLVDADEAAKTLNVSVDWLYHNHKKLPFAKKLGRKLIKFSVVGINRWIATRGV